MFNPFNLTILGTQTGATKSLMKILFIFPHPDDESFGPSAVMDQQLKAGHEVYLLTLTRGEATKQRHKLNVSKHDMGAIRFREMQCVAQKLGLTGMKVMDFPDNHLKELDPRVLENAVANHIDLIKPGIIVSYPVHGISGFHDHLVTHAVIKRVYLQMRDNGAEYLKRLAFFTLRDEGTSLLQDGTFRLKKSDDDIIDCAIRLNPENIKAMKESLNCYATYQEVIDNVGVVEKIGDQVYFEFFQENFTPYLENLTDSLFTSHS